MPCIYRGKIPSTPQEGTGSDWKSPQQYSRELQNMKEHGISYPTFEQSYYQMLGTALSLRDQSGLPKDHIYVSSRGTGNSTDPTVLAAIEQEMIQWRNVAAQHGYRDIYFYGVDEARGDVLRSERPAWQIVHSIGAKVFVACYDDAVYIVGDVLDVANVAGPLNITQVAEWHGKGKKIFSYANPQAGVENPELYRRNYGFALWNAGYDGAMDFAYQQGYNHIWNDFDSADTHYRDHVFAYPTTNGVIDTIQWEGWREGVDDTRYLAVLMKKEGSDVSGHAIITHSLSNGDDMATIREKIIEQILFTSPATRTGVYRPGAGFYLKMDSGTSWNPSTDRYLAWDNAAHDLPVAGDWNADGRN